MDQACPTRQKITLPPAFQNIMRPEVHIAQQPRKMSTSLQLAVASYLQNGSDLFLGRGTTDVLESELEKALPDGTRPLLDDILNLARQYQRQSKPVSGRADIRLRLEKIRGDSCRRFHVDAVTLRLLCTYAGPGVQWKYMDNDTVHDTPTGCITHLKGRSYPGWTEAGGVLHRSPPLSALVVPVTRLLLTLDHPDACGMESAHTDMCDC